MQLRWFVILQIHFSKIEELFAKTMNPLDLYRTQIGSDYSPELITINLQQRYNIKYVLTIICV